MENQALNISCELRDHLEFGLSSVVDAGAEASAGILDYLEDSPRRT